MVKWEVKAQRPGITDTMRLNILGAIRTAIETYGSSEMFQIAQSVRKWLQETYGGAWTVIVGKQGEWQSACSYHKQKYLWVCETDLRWTIEIFQQIP